MNRLPVRAETLSYPTHRHQDRADRRTSRRFPLRVADQRHRYCPPQTFAVHLSCTNRFFAQPSS
jgi:hypothetical protein